jgi:putative nucleotidyltransferase with HDIG domain
LDFAAVASAAGPGGITTPEHLANCLLRSLLDTLGASGGSVMLLDETSESLRIVAQIGLPTNAQGDTVPVCKSIAGLAMHIGKPLLLRGTVQSGSRTAHRQRRKLRCSMVIPVLCSGRCVGAVNVNRDATKPSFNAADLRTAESTVKTFGAMLEGHDPSPTQVTLSAIHALALTIEAKDPYTRGHCDRVRVHAMGISRTMGLDESMVQAVSLAAMLHDIGKIGVPEKVLLKPGRLTEGEFNSIKQHPQIGANILRPVCLPVATVQGVLHHHERFDGRGYPAGLQGADIPLAARILAVADTFDAMTEDRPYRMAHTTAAALEEIDRCAGAQFDPVVVAAFRQYICAPRDIQSPARH